MTFTMRDELVMHTGIDRAYQKQVEQIYERLALDFLTDEDAVDRAMSLDTARLALRQARETYRACRALVTALSEETSTP